MVLTLLNGDAIFRAVARRDPAPVLPGSGQEWTKGTRRMRRARPRGQGLVLPFSSCFSDGGHGGLGALRTEPAQDSLERGAVLLPKLGFRHMKEALRVKRDEPVGVRPKCERDLVGVIRSKDAGVARVMSLGISSRA